ncbi:MAG: protein translocase subunit SecF [Myxococcaceae bacterium]
MQLIKHQTQFDFIGKRRPAVFISTVVNLAILVGLAVFGLNLGVDFAGGTVVELKFPRAVSAEQVRREAEAGGLHDVAVQGLGAEEDHTFLLRLRGVTQLTSETGGRAEQALRKLATLRSFEADLDNGLLNFRAETKLETEAIRQTVVAAGPSVKEVRALGAAQGGGQDYQVVIAGLADKVGTAFSADAAKSPDFIRRVDYVGPQIGKQLRNRGVLALLYAMVAILIYVAFRFDFKFGPGALLAMLHDVVMVVGYYVVTRREFNLTSIAVLLTVVGYSINDTIVIYDRIREEMGRFKGKPLAEIINIAVNATLSRTLLTSGVTALSLVGLLIFGVGEIWDFAMAMLIGIIVGTYSSVYIASPLTIWLDERAAARDRVGRTRPNPA